MRILRHRETGQIIPHPRDDDQPAVGLDPIYEEMWLVQMERPILTPQQQAERFEEINEDTKTITRGWRITHRPEPPPPEPEPQWIAFGAALGGDESVNEFYGGLIQRAPVLYMMVGGGLLQAAQGDPRTFLTAWGMGLQAGLVTPELAAHVQAMAGPFDLPVDFVEALVPLPLEDDGPA
jgi:hypothetical protein